MEAKIKQTKIALRKIYYSLKNKNPVTLEVEEEKKLFQI